MENRIESQLDEVSKYIQKSFQLNSLKSSPTSDNPHSDDDLALLLNCINSPLSVSILHLRIVRSVMLSVTLFCCSIAKVFLTCVKMNFGRIP